MLPFLAADVTLGQSLSINLTEYETRSRAQLSATTPVSQTRHMYRLINTRLMTTICRIESNSNYYFVLMCQENREPVFDPSPICLHGDATGPQAGLQAFAFTPTFCLSSSISGLFHHASALIPGKHLQQRSVVPHLTVQIIIKATILLPQNMKLSFFFFFMMIFHNRKPQFVRIICEPTICVDAEQAVWPVGDNAISLITDKM